MGSPENEKDRNSDEGPVHTVVLPAFEIGKYEVTNAQYQRVQPQHRFPQGQEDHPAVDVSWDEVRAFCEHHGYRLPTEAEWEYAARAGTPTRWSFGDDEAKLGRYAWYSKNLGIQAHAVGTREPNPWGLHDMHGNVWEWVQDCWHDDYQGAPADGSTWEGGDCGFRVLRGGAFDGVPGLLRSAYRAGFVPVYRDRFDGFRCARAAPRQR
jgi:formylglycine-generating enzyme required for sulfatase activity